MTYSSDAELCDRLLRRDDSALGELIALYGALVHGMARRVVAEPGLAEEVAQDTFLALWRRPGAFDPQRGSMQAFLLGMARNKAVDLVRREVSAKRAKASLLAEAESASGSRPDPEGTDEAHERIYVLDVIRRLSAVQREAIVLAYFGGRTYREVASELGIPEGTAKTRLRDGLSRLRELMTANEGNG